MLLHAALESFLIASASFANAMSNQMSTYIVILKHRPKDTLHE